MQWRRFKILNMGSWMLIMLLDIQRLLFEEIWWTSDFPDIRASDRHCSPTPIQWKHTALASYEWLRWVCSEIRWWSIPLPSIPTLLLFRLDYFISDLFLGISTRCSICYSSYGLGWFPIVLDRAYDCFMSAIYTVIFSAKMNELMQI